LRHGWFVPVAYVVGFFVMLGLMGWEPHERHKPAPAGASISVPAPQIAARAAKP
jgi:hypothetical protein